MQNNAKYGILSHMMNPILSTIRSMIRPFVLLLLTFFTFAPLCATTPSPSKLKTLYNSLEPRSVSQHLAFYDLYPDTPEGKQALQLAWMLLAGKESQNTQHLSSDPFLSYAIEAIVALVNKQPDESIPELQENELQIIEKLAQRLPNRKLKGYGARSEAEVLALAPSEIDLARGLFLTQMGEQNIRKIRIYEAQIDLMALQILAQLPPNPSPANIIRTMNDFIFGEMGFRFPPHSIYAKEIDLYTFLPSVLDSRRGVCLGVSILYICLAQRLNLQLEMITPPGHIYVRYRSNSNQTNQENNQEINIETTARGVHIPSEQYLNIDTRSLQQRNIKEVIGLAHFNQASVYWTKNKYEEARSSYEKALPYLPGDKQLMELMAYTYILTGAEEEGFNLLKQVKDYVPEHAVTGNTMAEDLLIGAADAEGIKAIFTDTEEDRQSILKKQAVLEKVLERCPKFRAGWCSAAITWLQLHRYGEALEILKHYHQLDPEDPTTEYYLTMLYAERHDYNRAWEHFRIMEKILDKRNHHPKLLKELRRELASLSPE